MVSPDLLDVVLDGTANGAEIVESCAPSVDLRALEIDIPSLDEVVEELLVLLEFLSGETGTLRVEAGSMSRCSK